MLSEGRFQSIVWTRNTAESVLDTELLKCIREMKADVDAAMRLHYNASRSKVYLCRISTNRQHLSWSH